MALIGKSVTDRFVILPEVIVSPLSRTRRARYIVPTTGRGVISSSNESHLERSLMRNTSHAKILFQESHLNDLPFSRHQDNWDKPLIPLEELILSSKKVIWKNSWWLLVWRGSYFTFPSKSSYEIYCWKPIKSETRCLSFRHLVVIWS